MNSHNKNKNKDMIELCLLQSITKIMTDMIEVRLLQWARTVYEKIHLIKKTEIQEKIIQEEHTTSYFV